VGSGRLNFFLFIDAKMATVIITFVKVSSTEAAERGRQLRHYLGLGAFRASVIPGESDKKVAIEGLESAEGSQDNVTLGGKDHDLGK
jgi:hypothetical protein